MPTYVYECSSCKDTYEVEQRISEDALKDCRCGSKGTVKRIIQPVGVMFKGSGFHINDYAAKAGPASKEKSEDAPVPPPKSETKTETKIETAATEAKPAAAP